MNALEIIRLVQAYDAELVLEGDKLLVRGHGEQLPGNVQQALRDHKAEIMIALGAPIESTIASILVEIRPCLPPPLRRLSDGNLLVLVNWSILHAWNRAAGKL